MLLAAVLLPAYAIVGAGVGQRFDLLAGLLGLSVALLGAGYGLSSVMSVVLPYPVPESGESPFASPPGAAGVTLLSQTVASIGTAVSPRPSSCSPGSAGRVRCGRSGPPRCSASCSGVAAALVGIRIGARIFERRGPELLAALRRT